MGLKCLNDCKGQIRAVGRGRRTLFKGDERACPKCGEDYVIGVTDDFASEAEAYLIRKDPKNRADKAKEE